MPNDQRANMSAPQNQQEVAQIKQMYGNLPPRISVLKPTDQNNPSVLVRSVRVPQNPDSTSRHSVQQDQHSALESLQQNHGLTIKSRTQQIVGSTSNRAVQESVHSSQQIVDSGKNFHRKIMQPDKQNGLQEQSKTVVVGVTAPNLNMPHTNLQPILRSIQSTGNQKVNYALGQFQNQQDTSMASHRLSQPIFQGAVALHPQPMSLATRLESQATVVSHHQPMSQTTQFMSRATAGPHHQLMSQATAVPHYQPMSQVTRPVYQTTAVPHHQLMSQATAVSLHQPMTQAIQPMSQATAVPNHQLMSRATAVSHQHSMSQAIQSMSQATAVPHHQIMSPTTAVPHHQPMSQATAVAHHQLMSQVTQPMSQATAVPHHQIMSQATAVPHHQLMSQATPVPHHQLMSQATAVPHNSRRLTRATQPTSPATAVPHHQLMSQATAVPHHQLTSRATGVPHNSQPLTRATVNMHSQQIVEAVAIPYNPKRSQAVNSQNRQTTRATASPYYRQVTQGSRASLPHKQPLTQSPQPCSKEITGVPKIPLPSNPQVTSVWMESHNEVRNLSMGEPHYQLTSNSVRKADNHQVMQTPGETENSHLTQVAESTQVERNPLTPHHQNLDKEKTIIKPNEGSLRKIKLNRKNVLLVSHSAKDNPLSAVVSTEGTSRISEKISKSPSEKLQDSPIGESATKQKTITQELKVATESCNKKNSNIGTSVLNKEGERCKTRADLRELEDSEKPVDVACHVCTVTVRKEKDLIFHLIFGPIRCKNCSKRIVSCDMMKTLMYGDENCKKDEKQGKHHFTDWCTDAVQYLSYYLNKELIIKNFCKYERNTPVQKNDLCNELDEYLDKLLCLKGHDPWSAAMKLCDEFIALQRRKRQEMGSPNKSNVQVHNNTMPAHNSNMQNHNSKMQAKNSNLQTHNSKMPTNNSTMPAHNSNMQIHDKKITAKDSEMQANNSKMPAHNNDMQTHDKKRPAKDSEMQAHNSNMQIHDKKRPAKDSEMQTHDKKMPAKDSKMQTHDKKMLAHNSKGQVGKSKVLESSDCAKKESDVCNVQKKTGLDPPAQMKEKSMTQWLNKKPTGNKPSRREPGDSVKVILGGKIRASGMRGRLRNFKEWDFPANNRYLRVRVKGHNTCCPEECPECYCVICPSRFIMNINDFTLKYVCVECSLPMFFIFGADEESAVSSQNKARGTSKTKRKGKHTSIR